MISDKMVLSITQARNEIFKNSKKKLQALGYVLFFFKFLAAETQLNKCLSVCPCVCVCVCV